MFKRLELKAWTKSMIEIISARDVWVQLKLVYGGYFHVQKARVKSLNRKYDDIKMVEVDNVSQYGHKLKEVVFLIKNSSRTIEDDFFMIRMLITLLPIHSIIFPMINEIRNFDVEAEDQVKLIDLSPSQGKMSVITWNVRSLNPPKK